MKDKIISSFIKTTKFKSLKNTTKKMKCQATAAGQTPARGHSDEGLAFRIGKEIQLNSKHDWY